jgi:hypothetical protein
MAKALRVLGFTHIGQAGRGYFNDDPEHANRRSHLWHKNKNEYKINYPVAQGY